MCSKNTFSFRFPFYGKYNTIRRTADRRPGRSVCFQRKAHTVQCFFWHICITRKPRMAMKNRSADKYIAESSPCITRVLHHVGNGHLPCAVHYPKIRGRKPVNLLGLRPASCRTAPGMTISTPRPNGQKRLKLRKERNTIEFNASLETSLQQFRNTGQAAGATTSMHSPTSFPASIQKGEAIDRLPGGRHLRHELHRRRLFQEQGRIKINWQRWAGDATATGLYSASINIRSQFSQGYKSRTEHILVSDFMSPGYFDIAAGFTYAKAGSPFKITLAPGRQHRHRTQRHASRRRPPRRTLSANGSPENSVTRPMSSSTGRSERRSGYATAPTSISFSLHRTGQSHGQVGEHVRDKDNQIHLHPNFAGQALLPQGRTVRHSSNTRS